MKKVLAALAALVIGLSAAAADGTLRIIAVGNSFSQDAIEQYLWNLFDAAGQEVVIGNLYIGGCTLDRHFRNALDDTPDYAYRKVVDGVKTEYPARTLFDGLTDEPWDIVTFQQASGYSGLPDSYEPYLYGLIAYAQVLAPQARFYFHQTWAYAATSDHAHFPYYGRDQQKMYEAIMQAVQLALQAHPELVGVIPAGTAIQNGRTSSMGDTFNRDGFHLETTFGRFTAACTWYETLSGKPVTENPWLPEGMDPAVGAICKEAAHAACRNPFTVTPFPAQ